MKENTVNWLKIIKIVAALCFGLKCIFDMYYIVDPGYTGIHLRMGRIIRASSESGMYAKLPLMDNVIFINNRICKVIISTTALSHDLQTVNSEVAINYRINDAIKLYQTVGTDFEKIILDPYAQESIKAIMARFSAEELIQTREKAKEAVFEDLKKRLDPVFITLIDFNFVHLDFTNQFIHAVEEKQIAEQLAKTSHNLTEKVKEEATQTRTIADAEAYALNARKSCINKDVLELKKIEKWDGRLPRVSSNAACMLQI